jgi:hypothetical protein
MDIMKRFIIGHAIAVASVIVLFQPESAHAQPGKTQQPGQVGAPNVSPFLYLTNRNNSAAFNLYQGVYPRQQFNSAVQQQDLINQDLYNQDLTQGVLVTGHRSGFQNYQRYFMNNGAVTGTTGRPGVPGQARAGLNPQQQQQFPGAGGTGATGAIGARGGRGAR